LNLFIKEIFANINPQKKGFKKKLLSFTFFLLISTVFWVLNVLGEKYTEIISYPIVYKNLPKNKEVTSTLPKTFNLKVSTNGYTLLEHYLNTNITPIVIDYNKPKIKKYKFCLSKDYIEPIASLFSSNVDIHSIRPDSIHFQFQQIIRKEVPIQALVTYTIEDGFVNKGEVYSQPDSVEISGAKDLIDHITQIYTGAINLGTINTSTKRNVALKPIKGVKYKTHRTNVFVPIEQSTEKQIKRPIQIENTVDKDIIKLIPNSVTISYKVGLSRYTSISEEDFKIAVSYSDSTKNSEVLQVQLLQFPPDVYEVKFTPNFVEYLKERHD